MEKWKFLTLPGLEPWPLSRPARSQSLYRLRYPGSHLDLIDNLFNKIKTVSPIDGTLRIVGLAGSIC
jgi:hypothetical protein